MVRIIFGRGTDRKRAEAIDLEARTLGEALEQLEERRLKPAEDEPELRIFVDGVDANRLEGTKTPVGDEDTVLLTRW